MTRTGAKNVKCFAPSNPKANPWAGDKNNKQQVATFRYHCRDWWKGGAMVLAEWQHFYISQETWRQARMKHVKMETNPGWVSALWNASSFINYSTFIISKSFPISSGFDLFQPLSSSHCYVFSQNHNKLKNFVFVLFFNPSQFYDTHQLKICLFFFSILAFSSL